MSATLPRHPSLEHLKKQAKQLLAAQRHGVAACCPLLRKLRRFSSATDAEILAAQVTLAEAQMTVALHYGFSGWRELRDEVHSHPASDEFSLEGVRGRSREEIPEYAGAGVPLGVVAALNHQGVDIGFMEFAAASGWAFSFGYHYKDESPAHMAVRGRPGSDGPFEVFAFLPRELGLEYEMALTSEPDELWEFVKPRVDSGVPIMSEHLDGGLISAYRVQDGARQLFFDGTVMPGWTDVGGLHPYAVYSFVKSGDSRPWDEITVAELHRALEKGRAQDWKGTPQGLSALHAYLTDVSNPELDFSHASEWFCWAAFERLMARRCCEVWLRSVADRLEGGPGDLVLEAAYRYGEAFRHYDGYRSAVHGGEPTRFSLHERARTPAKIAEVTPLLEDGIAEETAGLQALEEALKRLE
jgi:hypothetical protein